MDRPPDRRLPVGAELQPGGGVHFRVWAPQHREVSVVLDEPPGEYPLRTEGDGYFSGSVGAAGVDTLYRLRVDGAGPFPDPASRFQPDGPHGPSQVVDPGQFRWTDTHWRGVQLEGQVIYEMHFGTFTQAGTYEGAARELPELAAAGITVLELMPVADFPGQFGWGYDGVDLFAPTRLYGRPEDLRRLVDRAHSLGLGVILDVVYNHFGPDGNYLKAFAKDYFTDKYKNEWGEAINFDGSNAGPVREFFAANAAYWIEEFHFDGLRLDATQQMFDDSPEHILAMIARRVRAAARGRSTILVAENEVQHPKLVRSADQGGYGLDALWNDDFHHSAMVALTGHNPAYYTDHRGTPQEFISAIKWGYLYQGQWYAWQKKRRGQPAFGIKPAAFVNYFQNHDQIANSARGLRAHQLTSPGRFRAMTALLLLAPSTPMLFQGEEFCASSPFFFFADHKPELAKQVDQGRATFLTQFPCIALQETRENLAQPSDRATFERSKLDLAERQTHQPAYALHKDLLRLRRMDPVFKLQRVGGVDGAVLGPEAFVLRFFGTDEDRLLVVNFGRDLRLVPAPEPLLAPPEGGSWQLRWSSEDWRYGGDGTPSLESEGWWIPGEAAVVLAPANGGKTP
ncbi:MAG TPA: malto-oligosyltrehalose trehalohydrolase [Gemmataceae bacterium]|nr:malto-oligosyltrehalose trehalohydrolase [Gemmataceae bacterium]